jgi:hypothetical protein
MRRHLFGWKVLPGTQAGPMATISVPTSSSAAPTGGPALHEGCAGAGPRTFDRARPAQRAALGLTSRRNRAGRTGLRAANHGTAERTFLGRYLGILDERQ